MTKTKAPLKRAEQKQLSERQLIEAAIAIADEQGVTAVTFASVAERAGYSRGLAFQKFGSKEGLIRAVVNFLNSEFIEPFDKSMKPTLSGLEALEAFVSMQWSFLRDEENAPAYWRLFANSIGDKTMAERIFRETHRNNRDRFLEYLTRGIEDGSVKPLENPKLSAEMFGSLLLGAAMHAITDPRVNLNEFEAEIVSFVRAKFSNKT